MPNLNELVGSPIFISFTDKTMFPEEPMLEVTLTGLEPGGLWISSERLGKRPDAIFPGGFAPAIFLPFSSISFLAYHVAFEQDETTQ